MQHISQILFAAYLKMVPKQKVIILVIPSFGGLCDAPKCYSLMISALVTEIILSD